jgi:predicted permease
VDRDLDAELDAHLELATEDNLRRGMSRAEARTQAVKQFGSRLSAIEQAGDQRGFPRLESFFKDVAYAFRGMRRNPGFTALAIAMLALGIGINTTVFTVTNAVLFKGFPLVERNDRLLYITTGTNCCVSWPDFQDWKAQAKSFEGMALVHGVAISFGDENGFPERYDATEVTSDTFKVAGRKPILGRDFTPRDEVPGATPVAILSYGLWERRFAKDPQVVGRTLLMKGERTTVIGVMPQGFSFPQKQDLWIPLMPTPEVRKRDNRATWFVFGRLADGVTAQSARAEMETIGRRLGAAYPRTNQGRNLIPHVLNFRDFFIGPNATRIYAAMWGAVGFVLLIACANLANLTLARATGRSREISLRIALGAGRRRIIRQLLVESVVLSGLGGCIGWWLAKWGVYALAPNGSAISDATPGDWFANVLGYSMDYRVLVYFIAISAGTGILFGLAPALRLSKLEFNSVLKDGGPGAAGGRRGKRLPSLLIMGEIALAIVLLSGAGVMIRGFLNAYGADPGFRPDNILTGLINLPDSRYPETGAQTSFFSRLQAGLEAIPGVESVALARQLPGWDTALLPYEPAGAPPDSAAEGGTNHPMLSALVTSPGYFHMLGAPLLSGREFTHFDGPRAAPVAIVNRRFADRHWPGQNPLGKRLRLFKGATPEAWLTVIGVAPDIAQNDSARPERDLLVYLPYLQRPSGDMWVMARTRVPPATIANSFRREVQALDPELPVSLGPIPLVERAAPRYRYRSFTTALFLIFAALALGLASAGLYAVVAHSVSRRTQEIGIRMAIGATAGDIRRLVLHDGMLPVATGLIVGLVASLAVNRILRAGLIDVSPADPLTLVLASVTLILAAVLGCLMPARRAAHVDPMVALRHE